MSHAHAPRDAFRYELYEADQQTRDERIEATRELPVGVVGEPWRRWKRESDIAWHKAQIAWHEVELKRLEGEK